MNQQWGNAVVVGVVIIVLFLFIHCIQNSQSQLNNSEFTSAERSTASMTLAEALPDSVFFSLHPIFVESIQSYWAMQERDIVPQCLVRPRSVKEVAIAVGILKRDYDAHTRRGGVPSLFAVRSGGHSPIPGAANTNGGIVIDLGSWTKWYPRRMARPWESAPAPVGWMCPRLWTRWASRLLGAGIPPSALVAWPWEGSSVCIFMLFGAGGGGLLPCTSTEILRVKCSPASVVEMSPIS